MKNTYGLKEVWIPENKHLEDEEYFKLPRSNIFMSEDFFSE